MLRFRHVYFQIPEPDVSIMGIHIDPDGVYLAAVNSKVSTGLVSRVSGVLESLPRQLIF